MFIGFCLFWKLISADLSKHQALDVDPRAIQQIIFTGKANQLQLFIAFLNNQKKQHYNFLKEQQKCCNYIFMAEYSKESGKLTDTQLTKLKATVKNKTGMTLRISLKMFNGSDLPHQLFLIIR